MMWWCADAVFLAGKSVRCQACIVYDELTLTITRKPNIGLPWYRNAGMLWMAWTLFEERVNFTPLHNSYLGNPRNPISLLPKPTKWSSVIQIAINLRWLFRFQPSFKWQARACRKPTKDLLLGEKGCKGCLVSWFSAPVPEKNHYGRRRV